MTDRLRDAFEPIHATEEMKQNTIVFLRRELARGKGTARPRLRSAFACFAALFFVVCGIGGYKAYMKPVSYISVDVNPSVEFGLNSIDRVVSVEAYNDDGALILQELNLKNKLYTEAVEALLANKTFGSYLTEGAKLSFTVVSPREEALLMGIRQCRGYSETGAHCHSADEELMEEAHHHGLSFGKYQAFKELTKYDKNITAEECKGLSMRQIRELIREYSKETEGDIQAPGEGHYGGGCSHGGSRD